MATPDVLSRKYDDLLNVVQNISHRVSLLEERTLQNANGWAGQQSNVTPTRAYDANATSTAELGDVLGTLINDLVEARVIS